MVNEENAAGFPATLMSTFRHRENGVYKTRGKIDTK